MHFEIVIVFVAFVFVMAIRAQIYCHRTCLSYNIDLLTAPVPVLLKIFSSYRRQIVVWEGSVETYWITTASFSYPSSFGHSGFLTAFLHVHMTVRLPPKWGVLPWQILLMLGKHYFRVLSSPYTCIYIIRVNIINF
jgi:hypothetical protein